MDKKHKDRTWFGNMYQKFEAVCDNLDDIVNQDTVKYVENKVQTVGKSMKKFYSDMLPNKISPSVDPINHRSEIVALKQTATCASYQTSMIDTKENSIRASSRDMLQVHGVNSMRKQLRDEASFSKFQYVDELISEPSVDCTEVSESNSSSGQTGNIFIHKITDLIVGGHAIERKSSPSKVLELFPPIEKDSCEAATISSVPCNDSQDTPGVLTKVSLETLSYDTKFKHQQHEGFSCNKVENAAECTSDIPSSVPSCNSSLCGLSCKSGTTEIKIIPSCSSISTGSLSLPEATPADIPQKVDNVYEVNNDGSGCIPHISQLALFPEPVSVSDKCGRKQLEDCILSSSSGDMSLESYDDFRNALTDPHMESIELCGNVKLEDRCFIVDRSVPYALSCRVPKLRSYKKKIQEAFASRKRLVKEYEQLGLLYGEIDSECSKQTEQNMLPAIATELKTFPAQYLCDSEWELL